MSNFPLFIILSFVFHVTHNPNLSYHSSNPSTDTKDSLNLKGNAFYSSLKHIDSISANINSTLNKHVQKFPYTYIPWDGLHRHGTGNQLQNSSKLRCWSGSQCSSHNKWHTVSTPASCHPTWLWCKEDHALDKNNWSFMLQKEKVWNFIVEVKKKGN